MTGFNCIFGMVKFEIVVIEICLYLRLLDLVIYTKFLSSLVGVAGFRMSLCCSGLAVATAVHCQVGVTGFWLRVDLLRVVFVCGGVGLPLR